MPVVLAIASTAGGGDWSGSMMTGERWHSDTHNDSDATEYLVI